MQEPTGKVSAKDIKVRPIEKKYADKIIRRIHYSGKTVSNSQLNFGVFLEGKLLGAMQYGPPTRKDLIIGLVSDTDWNGFFELNRLAFHDDLPRFSESRAISLSFKWMKKNAKHIKWVISFADGCQCGHGTIYQASNFKLTQIKENDQLVMLPDGTVTHKLSLRPELNKQMGIDGYTGITKWLDEMRPGWKMIKGYMLKYIYFLDKKVEKNFTGEYIPFSKIKEMGIGMYRGKSLSEYSGV